MNISKRFVLALLMVLIPACTVSAPTRAEQETETEMTADWFTRGDWRQGWNVAPDESIDKEEFYRKYRENPEAWDTAFRFLAEKDLSGIAPGRYELQGEALFVNVDEYQTRDEEDTRYEAHRTYADIQYLVSGTEGIGVVPLELTTVTEPYDAEKDITFLESPADNYRIADQGTFFIFFPGDAHRPCVKKGVKMPVRKVVVKVRID